MTKAVNKITSPKHLQKMPTNYKEEVLKVYPDAEIMVSVMGNLIGIISDIALDKYDLWELGSADTENEAWKSAYNTHILNQKQ